MSDRFVSKPTGIVVCGAIATLILAGCANDAADSQATDPQAWEEWLGTEPTVPECPPGAAMEVDAAGDTVVTPRVVNSVDQANDNPATLVLLVTPDDDRPAAHFVAEGTGASVTIPAAELARVRDVRGTLEIYAWNRPSGVTPETRATVPDAAMLAESERFMALCRAIRYVGDDGEIETRELVTPANYYDINHSDMKSGESNETDGQPDSEPSREGRSTVTWGSSSDSSELSPSDLSFLADRLAARLGEAGFAGVEMSVDGERISAVVDGVVSSGTVREISESRLTFRLVSAVSPGDTAAAECSELDARAAEDVGGPREPITACDDDGLVYDLEPTYLDGSHVDQVAAIQDPSDRWAVTVDFTDEGARFWEDLTREAVGSSAQIAIVVDAHILSAPTVDGPLPGGSTQISGFTEEEAADVADRLRFAMLAPQLVLGELQTAAAD